MMAGVAPAALLCTLVGLSLALSSRVHVLVTMGLAIVTGAAIAATGPTAWMLPGLPFVLAVLPARWALARWGPLPVKVLAGWLCAAALLGAALQFVPGPIGNMPDHME